MPSGTSEERVWVWCCLNGFQMPRLYKTKVTYPASRDVSRGSLQPNYKGYDEKTVTKSVISIQWQQFYLGCHALPSKYHMNKYCTSFSYVLNLCGKALFSCHRFLSWPEGPKIRNYCSLDKVSQCLVVEVCHVNWEVKQTTHDLGIMNT